MRTRQVKGTCLVQAKRGSKGVGISVSERRNRVPPPSVHHRRIIGAPLRLRLSPVTCARGVHVAAQGALATDRDAALAIRRRQTLQAPVIDAHSLLAHAPAMCARGARGAVQGACVWVARCALAAHRLEATRAAASSAPSLLEHTPVSCARGARVTAQGMRS